MAARTRCPVCGCNNADARRPASWTYEHCGLTGVVLEGKGVVLTDCDDCGEQTTTIEDEVQLADVIGMSLLTGGPGMTGEELRYLRTLYEMTQEEFAAAIGRGRRETIADWEARGTERVFKAPFDELNLRAVLMAMYSSKVIASEYCRLSPRHIKEFETAARTFIGRVGELVTGCGGRGPLILRRSAESGDWSSIVHAAV